MRHSCCTGKLRRLKDRRRYALAVNGCARGSEDRSCDSTIDVKAVMEITLGVAEVKNQTGERYSSWSGMENHHEPINLLKITSTLNSAVLLTGLTGQRFSLAACRPCVFVIIPGQLLTLVIYSTAYSEH